MSSFCAVIIEHYLARFPSSGSADKMLVQRLSAPSCRIGPAGTGALEPAGPPFYPACLDAEVRQATQIAQLLSLRLHERREPELLATRVTKERGSNLGI